jgi:hypothetical protein
MLRPPLLLSWELVSSRPHHQMLKVTQKGLILKVLSATEMLDCNTWGSPVLSAVPLGMGADRWTLVEGYMALRIGHGDADVYLSFNAHPEIQFSIHQCARFTHCPRLSHKEAMEHICWY